MLSPTNPSSPATATPRLRADFLRRLGRVDEARGAYDEALLLTENAIERAFLERRLVELR